MYQKQRYLQRQPPNTLPQYVSNGLYEDNNNIKMGSSTHSNKEIQTDLETDVESEISRSPIKPERSHRVIRSSATMDFSEDESCSFGTESAGEDFSWAQNAERSPSLDYMVEEQIEEITTTFEDPSLEDEITLKGVTKHCCQAINEPLISQKCAAKHTAVPDLGCYCSGLEFAESRRVPFPEYGMDFIDGEEIDDSEEKGIAELLLVSDRWEDNWLFKKKKTASPFRNMGNLFIGEEPISMLVPNPIEDVQAKIGNRDVDELSDMSEKLSNGSMELYQSDLESKDDDCNDFQEQGDTVEAAASEVAGDKGSQPMCVMRKMYDEAPVSPPVMRPFEYKLFQNATHCTSTASSNVREPIVEKTRPTTLQLHVPTPKPRKSKSSICSDRDQPVAEQRTPRFVPLASRKGAQNPQLKFSRLPESISVLAGRMARITCQLSSPTTYNMAWFHGCEPLECGELYQFYSIGNNHVLEIYDAQEMDGGTYSCLAYNESEEAWADFVLSIVGSTTKNSSPHFNQHLTSCSVEAGKTAALRCKIRGIPEPQLILYKDDKMVQPSEHVSIDRNSYGDWLITINNAAISDSGEYKVVASNKVGEAISQAEVAIVPQGASEVMALTKRTNHVQNAVYLEAEDMVKSANKQSAANSIRQTTGKALDIIGNVTNKAKDNQERKTSTTNDNFYIHRPDLIPGTIAERERMKWQNPVDLPNNPYSPENIEKRIQRSESLTRSPLLPDGKPIIITPEDETDQHTVVIIDGPKKIDCGLKDIDPDKYRRDYYVHHVPSAPVRNKRRLKAIQSKSTKVDLNDVEEKVYISTGRVLHLEDKIKNLEAQVNVMDDETSQSRVDDLEDKVARAVAQVTQSEKQVSKVEQEVARLQKKILDQQQQKRRHSSHGSKNGDVVEVLGSSSSLDKWTRSPDASPEVSCLDTINQTIDVPLPSVKALADKFNGPTLQSRQFTNGSFEHKEDGSTMVKIDTSKVHSLTARSLCKEFRDATQYHLPRQMNRKQSITVDTEKSIFTPPGLTEQNFNGQVNSSIRTNGTAIVSPDDGHGYTSDESSTSTNSLSRTKPVKKLSRSIQNRAAFWDRRVKEERMSDPSMCDEFPPMEALDH